MSDNVSVTFPTLLYVVVAPLGADIGADQPAFLADERPEGTFDERLLPCLVGIWYVMHLPKNRFEVLDLPLAPIRDASNGVPRPHRILLIPEGLLSNGDLLRAAVSDGEAVLLICPRDNLEAARVVSDELDFSLPPVAFDELNQAILEEHWASIIARWTTGWPSGAVADSTVPRWTWPISPDGSLLSLVRLSRLIGRPLSSVDDQDDPFRSAVELRKTRVYLDALVDLENRGIGAVEVPNELPGALDAANARQRARLSLSISGTAPRYVKFSVGPRDVEVSEFKDSYKDVRTVLVTHAATGDDSFGVVLEDVLPAEAFHVLAELERHWARSARPQGVRRLLTRLNAVASPIWTDELVGLVKSSSGIEAFTNFPIGLLTLPGDSAPLSSRMPVSYRPVNPLTRALQFELSPQFPRLISRGTRVLVAECIAPDDAVGMLSRTGWELVQREMSASGGHVEVAVVEAQTKEAFRAAVEHEHPDVLVISAHGFSAPDSNLAGIMIGDEPSLGDDLGRMPPLVILSACHTSPRGGGVVSVADLLVRDGALAVLSTLVPVDVTHNAQTMARFFRYLSRSIEESSGSGTRTIADVWHETQCLNVVIDLTYGNRLLQQWAFERESGPSPIEQFMSTDHGVPLRGPHIYQDAEQRLLRVAALSGIEERVRAWLRTPGYLPETPMYTLIGNPQLLRV